MQLSSHVCTQVYTWYFYAKIEHFAGWQQTESWMCFRGFHFSVNVIIYSISLNPRWKVKTWKGIKHGPFKYLQMSSSNVLCSELRGIAASCLYKLHLLITTQMWPSGSKQGFPLMIICLRNNKTQQWQDWNTSKHTSINMDKHLRTTFTQPLGCSFIAHALTADTSGVARRKTAMLSSKRWCHHNNQWWIPKTCECVCSGCVNMVQRG